MKYLITIVALLTSFVTYSGDNIDDQKHLTALYQKIAVLSEEVSLLKEEQRLEIKIVNESVSEKSNINSRSVVNTSYVTSEQFSELAHSVVSRVDSTDESVGTLLTFIGWIATAWGIIITILLGTLAYLHFGSLQKAISDSDQKLEMWLDTTALKKIDRIATDAEDKLKFIQEREEIARNNIAEKLDIQLPTMQGEDVVDNQLYSAQLKSAISSYKSRDFPVAILTSKLVLEKDIALKDRVEATQIIANSYQALNLNEFSIKYNEKLQELISLYQDGKPRSLGVETALHIVMNKYPVDSSKGNEDTRKLIDSLVSSYFSDTNIEVMRSVAKARMLKAIIHENNNNYLNAITIYKGIIHDYTDNHDKELLDIVVMCRNNLGELETRD